MPASEINDARPRRRPGDEEEELKLINVDLPSQTAAQEPVLVRRANNNERNELMKTVAYTGRFYTTPDRVRPPGAEIEEGNLLATSLAYPKLQPESRLW
jgi:hypothetical protein